MPKRPTGAPHAHDHLDVQPFWKSLLYLGITGIILTLALSMTVASQSGPGQAEGIEEYKAARARLSALMASNLDSISTTAWPMLGVLAAVVIASHRRQ